MVVWTLHTLGIPRSHSSNNKQQRVVWCVVVWTLHTLCIPRTHSSSSKQKPAMGCVVVWTPHVMHLVFAKECYGACLPRPLLVVFGACLPRPLLVLLGGHNTTCLPRPLFVLFGSNLSCNSSCPLLVLLGVYCSTFAAIKSPSLEFVVCTLKRGSTSTTSASH